MLLPFQQKWVTDNSRLKLCVKSRQTGLSWTTAYRVVRQKLAKSARLDAWVSSRDETQALLFIEDANGLQTSLTSQPRTWARTSSTIKDIHCCIDRSGLGRQFAERAAQRFGAYKVEGVDFTTGTKEELAFPYARVLKIARFGCRSQTPSALISAAFAGKIRSGNIRFAGERNR